MVVPAYPKGMNNSQYLDFVHGYAEQNGTLPLNTTERQRLLEVYPAPRWVVQFALCLRSTLIAFLWLFDVLYVVQPWMAALQLVKCGLTVVSSVAPASYSVLYNEQLLRPT